MKFQRCNIQVKFTDWWLMYLLWNCTDINIIRNLTDDTVNICSVIMAWCSLADSHYPNRSPEQCLHTQSYVIIRLKLVNFTTLLLAETVNGTGCPCTQRSTGHSVSVSRRPAAQCPTGHCVAGHLGTQCPTSHCVAGHPGTQWWTGHCLAGHPGTQPSTAHCVAGTRVHSIVLT